MLNLKERAKGKKTKSKIIPDKTIKVKKQTSDIMSKTLKKETKEDKLRKFQKIKQKIRPKQNPFISSANPGDIPIKSKIKKSIVDAKSPRTRRATRVKEPVKGNIGEIKTSTKKPIIDTQKRTGNVKGNIGEFKTKGKSKIAEVDSSKREKFKTKQAIKNRPGEVKTSGPSSVDNSQRGKRTTKVDQFVTKMKMKADNILRESDNRNKELYKMIHGKEYEPSKKLKGGGTVGNSRSYRGYGAARKG